MRFQPRSFFRTSVLVFSSLFFVVISNSQVAKLDDLSSQVLKDVKPLKPHLISVVDLRPLDNSQTAAGHYLAWMLSEQMKNHARKKVTISEHTRLDSDLAALHVSVLKLVPGDGFKTAASGVGADVLITGTIEYRDSAYHLTITPIHVADGRALPSIDTSIQVTEFMMSMAKPFPEGPLRASGKSVILPVCILCPDPTYTDFARHEKVSGQCVLDVLISADGTVGQIRPLKFLGYGLDEKAYYAIKNWKFKPALQDSKPVAVIVPIEVTFRLY
jgi:TonB family protein